MGRIGRNVIVGGTLLFLVVAVAGCAEEGKKKARANSILTVMEERGIAVEKQTRGFDDPVTGKRMYATFVIKVDGTAVEMFSVDGMYPEVGVDAYELPAGWKNIVWQGSGGTVLIQR